MLRSLARLVVLVCLASALMPAPSRAQSAPPAQQPEPAAPPPRPVEIDLNVTNLPTTLSLRRHQSYFRLTHRFARDLRRGSFGQLAEDLFSLDSGAIIGLEYRFGLTGNLQAGVHRSLLSKTIQVFGKYDAWRQDEAMPVSISLLGSIEGLNNLQDDHQPALVASVSRAVARQLVLYATPGFVANTRSADFANGGDEENGDEHTLFLGLAARARLRPTVFVTGEFTPRLAGHDPGRGVWGVSIEKLTRGGGHTMQLNFTNSFGTTFGQLARGGSSHDVYLGFNITRKF